MFVNTVSNVVNNISISTNNMLHAANNISNVNITSILPQVFPGAISLSEFLIVAAILFGLGVAGILMNRKNIIAILMSVELMLLAVNTNFIAFSHFLQNNTGEIFVFFILTVAAAEAAIGLAIMVVLFRRTHTIEVENLDRLKG